MPLLTVALVWAPLPLPIVVCNVIVDICVMAFWYGVRSAHDTRGTAFILEHIEAEHLYDSDFCSAEGTTTAAVLASLLSSNILSCINDCGQVQILEYDSEDLK